MKSINLVWMHFYEKTGHTRASFWGLICSTKTFKTIKKTWNCGNSNILFYCRVFVSFVFVTMSTNLQTRALRFSLAHYFVLFWVMLCSCRSWFGRRVEMTMFSVCTVYWWYIPHSIFMYFIQRNKMISDYNVILLLHIKYYIKGPLFGLS